jgi:hypothetical protein
VSVKANEEQTSQVRRAKFQPRLNRRARCLRGNVFLHCARYAASPRDDATYRGPNRATPEPHGRESLEVQASMADKLCFSR